MRVVLLWCLLCALACSAKEYVDKLDRYIITCHTTDFECFKRQYKALRDNVLLGNEKLAIDEYEPLYVQYGNTGTCIKFSGLEESELIGIGMGSNLLSLTLELPLRVQQVNNDTKLCAKPESAFADIESEKGIVHGAELKKFTGNATIQVVFRYEMRKKKSLIHMKLMEEDMDVIFDIPQYLGYDRNNTQEQIVEQSEWAYGVIQHINGAQDFALPYTNRFRYLYDRLPIQRFIMLYPEEEYTDLNFVYGESDLLQTFL